MTSVQITSDLSQPHGQRQALYVDGERLKGVTSLRLDMEANEAPTVEVTMAVIELDAEISDATVRLAITAAAREGLIQLGWTPPEN